MTCRNARRKRRSRRSKNKPACLRRTRFASIRHPSSRPSIASIASANAALCAAPRDSDVTSFRRLTTFGATTLRPMSYALRLLGIHKRYRVGLGSCRATVDALRGVTLHVRADEIVVIVGRPGSGKSTLLRCAAGLLRPDRGRVRWFDQRPPPGGRPAGVLYRSVPSHYGCMTVSESLSHAMLHREITPQPPAVHRALERVGMASE